MNRKVKAARLQSSIYIPGIGDLGPTLPSKDKNVPGFTMVATDLGLEIFGKNEEALVPWPNVQCVTFEENVKFVVVKDSA